MDISINERTSVDYTFDLKASAEDLDGDILKEMRRYRSGLSMKGFRPGKVPLSVVKKMYGKGIALQVVERAIQEKFEEAVASDDAYDILGAPQMDTFDYEPFGALHAVINFGVKPEVELQEMGGEEVTRVRHEIDDEEIEEEIEEHRKNHAQSETHEGPAGKSDVVKCNIQRLDLATDTPVVGERQEDVSITLGNPDILPELKSALVGAKAGDVVKATLPAPEGEADQEQRRLELTVVEVSRQILPDLDEEFIEHATGGEGKTLDDLKEWTRKHLEERWGAAVRQDFRSSMIDAATKLHSFEVPKAAVESYLDNYVQEMKRQSNTEMPESFDEEAFRESQRSSAEEAVRWQLIRDKIVTSEGFSVSPADLDAKFEEMGKSRGVGGDVMRKILEAYNPDGVQQIEKEILDDKVFDYLAGSFNVVDKPFEEVYGEDKTAADAES